MVKSLLLAILSVQIDTVKAGCGVTGVQREQRGNHFQGGTDSDLMRGAALNGDGSVVSFDEFQYAFNWEGRVRAWDWVGGAWQESFNSVGPTKHRIHALL